MEWDILSKCQVDDYIKELSHHFFFGDENQPWEKWGYRDPKKEGKPIHINHPVLGTIRINYEERILLNSKPLQRLKNISQMGVGYMTYPGASHSRFVHTLGVMHLADQMVNKIQPQHSLDLVLLRKLVRFTALLHDIGHGPFSHLSEYLFSFQTNLWVAGAHEELVAKLLRTEDGKEFMQKVGISDDLIEKIPLTIQGDYNPNDSLEFSLGAKIINSELDADKLEYINTDSHFTGLNLPSDLDRLLTQVQYKEIAQGDFDLFVNEKGARSFHIILRAKELLYPTVYHHHTTCGFEGLIICGVLSAIQDEFSNGSSTFHSTLDLLKLTDWELLDILKNSSHPIARDCYKRINHRFHYRVVYDFRPWFFVRKDDLELNRRSDKLWNEIFPSQEIKKDFQKRPFKGQSLTLKKKIIEDSGVNLQDKFRKLSQENISEEELIDYVIFINHPIAMEIKPYTTKRIFTQIANKEQLFSLLELGYPCPRDRALQTLRIMVLPEIRKEIRKTLSEKYDQCYII